jgi:nucleoside-diphosphate-sugar epimerase
MSRTVLLTGGSGFIGGHALAALRADPQIAVRALVHHTAPPGAGVVRVDGDLSHPDRLRGICDGVDTLVHLASYIGPDPARCDTVNRAGTEALVDEAVRVGVKSILYLSTAAVYGPGRHRDLVEDAVPPAPVSPVSASRLAAERTVRAAGGVALRPMFVYGTGDRWFIPAVAAAMDAVPFLVDGGRARLSVIDARDLARLLHAVVRSPERLPPGTVHHANHPAPVSYATLARSVADLLGRRPPTSTLDYAEAERLTHGTTTTPRRLSLLTSDHWYASTALWERLHLTPGSGLPAGITGHRRWYRQLLGAGTVHERA